MHYQSGPISTVAGHYAKEILWPNAGVGPEDINLTRSLVQAGKLLDIEVLDHLVIGMNRWVSLKERGLGFG